MMFHLMSSPLRFVVLLAVLIGQTQFGFAEVHSKSLDSAGAADLSLSLFRDNYDIWAGEMMEKILVETTQKIVPLQEQIEAAGASEKLLDEKIRVRLSELFKSSVVDETSVHAALLLAKISNSAERGEYLRRAVRMAQLLSAGSVETLRVSLVYLVHLLSTRSFSDAEKFSEKILEFSEQTSLRQQPETCLAFILAGDVNFQNSNFSSADTQYKKAEECTRKNGLLQDQSLASLLELRLAWSSFRLMKYPDTLSRLERLLSAADWRKAQFSNALKTDLAVTLGVSLSEVAPQTPPTIWVRSIDRESWVADGLIRAIKYFVQKEQFRTAVKWSETLEPYLSLHPLALDYFLNAMSAFESDGALESLFEFRSRAVASLHPHGPLARALSLDPSTDGRRRRVSSDWARAVIAYRRQQDPTTLGVHRLNNLYRVAESLFEDKVEACSDSGSFIDAHHVFASARQDAIAERVYGWFKDCKNVKSRRSEVELVRLEMFRSAALRAVKDDESWKTLIENVLVVLTEFNAEPEIRRLALDTLNDGLERSKYADSERIFLLYLLTAEHSGENAQFERDVIVSAAVRLMSLRTVSPQLEAAAWSLLRTVSRKATVSDLNRKKLENALGFYASRLSLEQRNFGKFSDAFSVLLSSAEKFPIDSETGQDLLFRATELACVFALERECLGTSERIIAAGVFPAHDLAQIHHLRGHSLQRNGMFLSAAESWLSGVRHAMQSSRAELISMAKKDVIRAGEIFAEMKLWDETLEARAALTSLASVDGKSAVVHRVLLKWTLQAADARAFDKSAALAADLQKWLAEGVGGRAALQKRSDALPLVVLLSEIVPQALSSGQPASAYETTLLEVLNRANAQKGLLIRDDYKLNLLARKLVSTAMLRWHAESLRSAEIASLQPEFSQLASSLPTLKKSFDNLVLGCKMYDASVGLAFIGRGSCLSDVSRVFKGVTERTREAALRQRGIDVARLRQFDSAWTVLRSRVLATGGPAISSERRSAVFGNVLAERNLNFWSRAEGISAKEGSAR